MKVGDKVTIVKPGIWEGFEGVIVEIVEPPQGILVHFTNDSGSKWCNEEDLTLTK